MGKTLFDELVVLDDRLAHYYQYLMKRHPNAKLSRAEAHELFDGGLLDGGEITGNEVEALALLVERRQFSNDALEYLRTRLRQVGTWDALAKGGAAKRLSGWDLEFFNIALDQRTVGSINFRSPETGMVYTPGSYQEIKELVRLGKIRVYDFVDTRINPAGVGFQGFYDPSANILAFYRYTDTDLKLGLIVHEATHAFQDWQDRDSLAAYAEADAYIAEAVALRTLGKRLPPGSNVLQVAYDEAAPWLINKHKGKARSNYSDWLTAYQNVVRAVLKDYKITYNDRYENDEKGRPSERDQLLELRRALNHEVSHKL